MTLEKALVTQAGPYMLAAKAQALIDAEVRKGCDSYILPNPVALEPIFNPINVPKDIMALKERPCWVYESPPSEQDMVRYQVWISPDQPFNWSCFELFLKQFGLVSYRVGLEIIGNQQKIVIRLLCHRQDIPVVTTAFYGKLKLCKLTPLNDGLFFDIEPIAWERVKFYDYFPEPPYYHLLTRPNELHTSPFECLITAMANIPSPVMGIYQVLFQPVSKTSNWHHNIEILMDLEYIVKLIANVGHFQRYAQQAPSGNLRQMAGEVETKAHNDKPFYAAALRVAVLGTDSLTYQYLQSLAVFSSLFQHGGRPLGFITEAQYRLVLSPQQFRQMFLLGLTYRPGFLVNSAELTGLVHLPSADIFEQLEVDIDTVETLTVIATGKLSEGTPIGISNVAGQESIVCIPDELRLCHTHLIGSPRKGKSTLMENMIMDDIKKGHGVAVLDPHHDMVDRLLSLIPEEAIDRVIYFNPSDSDWVPLWNPMQKIPGQDIGRITDDLIGVLKSFVTGWGDRMEHLLRQAIFGLLHLQGSTLRDVYDILCNWDESQTIRKLVLEVVQNDVARHFWKEDITKYKPDELGPPKHKLSKLLLSDTAASLMLSQPRSAFNFRRIMDDGMIFLADLSSNLGTEVKEIIGGFIVAVMYITALSRSDIPREKRRTFHIYLDEAPKFVTDTLEEIIAEAPKHGVSLTLAHQYLRQFDTKKMDALGTIGTSIVFNVDTKDASYLSKDFKKKADVNDFIDLEQGEAIVRCGTEIVKIKTLGPLKEPEKNFKERIIAESREKYYMPAPEVRRMIERRNERANKAFEPLVPVMDNRKKTFISQEFEYDEF